jgi:hypothetical protein
MKGLVSGLLVWAVGLAGSACAQEVQWRAARPESPAPVSLAASVSIGQPLPLARVSQSAPAPAVIRASAEAVEPPPAVPLPEDWGGFGPCGPQTADAAPPPVPEGTLVPPDGPGPEGPHFYVQGEYLMWWLKEQHTPPLVTTSPPASNGILGMPGTVVLFGGSGVGGDLRSGMRLTAGAWCDDEGLMGVEASGFFLGQRSLHFSANSSTFPVLARPFFSITQGTESAQVAASPGLSQGTVSVGGPSSLWGAEIDLRCNLCCGCLGRLDFLVGPRYLQLDEGLHISEYLLGLSGAGQFAGSHINVSDSFNTRNQFYGGQLGLNYEFAYGPWSLDLLGKLALGEVHQVVDVSGGQVIISPTGAVTTFNGGLLALATNSGHFTRDRFAVLPELGITLGFQVTDWCRLSVGYSFLYLSSVVRPGDQIDRVLNVTRIPNFVPGAVPSGPLRPMPLIHDTDFWAQGINFGVEFRF